MTMSKETLQDGAPWTGKPALHDYIARLGLQLAKVSRRKYQGDPLLFYEDFLTSQRVYQSKYDLRLQLRRVAVADALGSLLRGAVVVDVGCGVGEVLSALTSHTTRVGIEYSKRHLGLAKELSQERIALIRASSYSIPIRTRSVDAVICLEVIEHLEDDEGALREISRVLKPGGQLVISVPHAYYFPEYLTLLGHYRHYTRQGLTARLQRAQFRVVQYVEDYPLVQKLHYYPYMLFAGWHHVLNRCGCRAESMYTRPIIGRLYQISSRSLSVFKRLRSQSELASDKHSTFLVAEKTT